MTFGTANIVAPVFTAPEIVVFFSTGVAGKASLGDFFRRFVFERNDLRRIAFCSVGLAWTMAGFAASDLTLPTADRGEFGVGSVRVSFELVLVTILAGFAANVVSGAVGYGLGLARLGGLRRTSRGKQDECSH